MSDPIYRLPDYSAWLTPENLAEEDRLWLACGYFRTYAGLVTEHLGSGLSVVEFGCGSGLVQTQLPENVMYVGIDANEDCVRLARKRAAMLTGTHVISHADVRTVPVAEVDLTCAFAFLKHFALFEWKEIAANVMRPGRRSVFTIPVVESDYEDGTAYPHARVSEATLRAAADAAGHTISGIRWLPDIGETAVFTVRK